MSEPIGQLLQLPLDLENGLSGFFLLMDQSREISFVLQSGSYSCWGGASTAR